MRRRIVLVASVSFLALAAAANGAEIGYYYRNTDKPSVGVATGASGGNSAPPVVGSNNAPVIRPLSLAAPNFGAATSAGDSAAGAFIVSGGVPPYTFASSGGLPDGIDLNADGSLGGMFLRAGDYSFGATVTDAQAKTATASTNLQVRPPPPIISVSTPTTAIAGTPFTAAATQAQGGLLTYTLPSQPGWLAVAGDGTVSGEVPRASPNFGFDVLGTDVYGRTDLRSSGSVSVIQPTATLSGAPSRIVEGDAVSGTLSTNMPGATWTKLSGPSWLTVSPAGVISGQSGDIPAGADAVVAYAARATLASGTADASGTLNVVPATVTLAGGNLRSGKGFTLPLSTTMVAQGTYTLSSTPSDVTSLAVSGSSITGVAPVVTQNSTRNLIATRTASSGGATASASSVVTVYPRLSITAQPQNLTGKVGSQVTFTRPTWTNAVGPTRISLTQNGTDISGGLGALCPGLTFDRASATVSGVPTESCSVGSLNITINDAQGENASDSVTSSSFSILMEKAQSGVQVNLPNGYSAKIDNWTSLPKNVTYRLFWVSSNEAWFTMNYVNGSCNVDAGLASSAGKLGSVGYSANCYGSSSAADSAWSAASGQPLGGFGKMITSGSPSAMYSSVYYTSSQITWTKY